MSENTEMPADPARDPEQAVDALEENLFGKTMDQDRDDSSDPDHDQPADGTTTPPTTTESPA